MQGVTRPRGKLELEEATEVEVEAIGDGPLSSWNVDGEIVIAKRLRAQVMSGLVQVFSRGLDAGEARDEG